MPRETDAGDPTPPTRGIDVVTHNVWVGQRLPALRRNLARLVKATGGPHAIFLQEAGRGGDWSLPGYRAVVAPRMGAEHDNCRILIRKDGRLLAQGAIRVPGGAWEWKKPKPPRIYPWAVVEWGEARYVLIGVHRIPRGPKPHRRKNRRAWDAEHRALVRLVEQLRREYPDAVIVPGGDWNTTRTKAARHWSSLRSLANRLGALVRVLHIDGFLVVNGTAGRAEKLEAKYGSDGHRPVWLRNIRPATPATRRKP